jgi:hypothetical protein
MERQPKPISPPLEHDRDTLADYSAIIQDNAKDLFQLAHKHRYLTSAPTSNEGTVGDVFLVEESSTFKLYAKFPSGWKSVTLT